MLLGVYHTVILFLFSSSNRISAGLPNITGSLENGTSEPMIHMSNISSLGALSIAFGTKKNLSYTPVSAACPDAIIFNASESDTIYGNSETVTPLSQKTNFIIKY